MYAAIRQSKAKTGMAEELARRIKEGAIPIISDVEGFMAYYVVYAPDDTVTAISIFNNFAGAEEFEPARRRVDRAEPHAIAHWTGHRRCRAGDRPYAGITVVVATRSLARSLRRAPWPQRCGSRQYWSCRPPSCRP